MTLVLETKLSSLVFELTLTLLETTHSYSFPHFLIWAIASSI